MLTDERVRVPGRTMHRAVDVVMGSTGLRDTGDAEEVLRGLARHLNRPLDAVAQDLADGRDFPGRPAWL